jgi:hypothetical protein
MKRSYLSKGGAKNSKDKVVITRGVMNQNKFLKWNIAPKKYPSKMVRPFVLLETYSSWDNHLPPGGFHAYATNCDRSFNGRNTSKSTS